MTAPAPLPGVLGTPVEAPPARVRARAGGRSGARVCGVPGCGAVLYAKNQTGVCRLHNHAAGFCGCGDCASGRRLAVPPVSVLPVPAVAAPLAQAPRPPRPGVAQLRVRGDSGSVDGRISARTVSLPAPPDPALRREIFG